MAAEFHPRGGCIAGLAEFSLLASDIPPLEESRTGVYIRQNTLDIPLIHHPPRAEQDTESQFHQGRTDTQGFAWVPGYSCKIDAKLFKGYS